MKKTAFLVTAGLTIAGVVGLIVTIRGQVTRETQNAAAEKTKKAAEASQEIMVACDELFRKVVETREAGTTKEAGERIDALKKTLFEASNCLRGGVKKLSHVAEPGWQAAPGRTGASILEGRLARVSSEMDLLFSFDPKGEKWFSSPSRVYFQSEKGLRSYELRYARYAEAFEKQRDPQESWKSPLLHDVAPYRVSESVPGEGEWKESIVSQDSAVSFFGRLKKSASSLEALSPLISFPLRDAGGSVLAADVEALKKELSEAEVEALLERLKSVDLERLVGSVDGAGAADGAIWASCRPLVEGGTDSVAGCSEEEQLSLVGINRARLVKSVTQEASPQPAK